MARQVERRVVIDDDGDAVMIETETTGVVVENEEGRSVLVNTAVRGVVLGNVLSRQQQSMRDDPSSPLLARRASQDDGGCSCCCVLKWTLFTIVCLPFLPLFCLCYYCCLKDDH